MVTSTAPTEAQLHILRSLDRLLKASRVPPTMEELANEAKRGRSTAAFHFWKLREAGYVETIPGRHRSVSITQRGRRALRKGGR